MSSLTPFADMNPVPRVLVDVPVVEFPAGSVTVSLTRTAEGRTFMVRGGQRLPAGSPAIVLDPEAPFGVESSYTVLGYDADGNLVGSWPIGTVTLHYDEVVVQQPLDPRLAVEVLRLKTTAAEIVRETPSELIYPQGQSLPGMIGLGPRRGIQGVALDLFVRTHAEADALQETLGTYTERQLPVWLIRTPARWGTRPGQRLPRVFFCHVPQTREVPINAAIGWEYVQLSAVVSETRPPAVGVSGAVLTHSDMKVFFTTHTQVKAQYGTHSDIKRDTSLIGAADA